MAEFNCDYNPESVVGPTSMTTPLVSSLSESRFATAVRAGGRAALTASMRAAERIRPPRLRTAADVPGDIRAINEEWLTAVLCQDRPGLRVIGFTTDNRSSQTTSRASLKIAYSEHRVDGPPRDVFVKLMASTRQRLLAGLIHILDGEAEFYGRLRSLAEFECPEGYFGGVDRRSWACATLIEDIVATRGATFCHATTPIDRPSIESLLSTMASFHGQYWEHPAIVDSALKRPEDHFRNIGGFLNARKSSAVGIERAPGFPTALRARQDELWEGLDASMHELSRDCPPTLLHGDAHVGNTYRTADGTMAFADWQVVMRGGFAYDFADIVSTALETEDRREWERDLLEFYLDRLQAAGGQPPGFDDAWDLYRRSLMYPLFCWATVLGAPSWMPDTQPAAVATTIVERVGAAIDDTAALNAF